MNGPIELKDLLVYKLTLWTLGFTLPSNFKAVLKQKKRNKYFFIPYKK